MNGYPYYTHEVVNNGYKPRHPLRRWWLCSTIGISRNLHIEINGDCHKTRKECTRDTEKHKAALQAAARILMT